MKNTKTGIWLPLKSLVVRNVKIFMKDKMMVFFSILAPVIVLLLYVLFLRKMQTDSMLAMLTPENLPKTLDPSILEKLTNALNGISRETKEAALQTLVSNWMLAGVMSVSCITVAFNACTSMVRDRERGTVNDVFASPIPRWVVYLSYILSGFIITFGICFAVLVIALIYLAAAGSLMMSFINFLQIVCTTVLSILSSSFFMVLIISFIKTEGALTSFNSVFSAVIGFLIGAYMPVGMLPKAIQYLCLFIPGTYSAGLFRHQFMKGPIAHFGTMLGLGKEEAPEVVNQILQSYSVNMEFFGMPVSVTAMVLVLIGSVLVFGALIWILYSNKKTNFFALTKKKKRKRTR